MDHPSGNNEQSSKRQAIKSIVEDASLSAPEKQQLIQDLMAIDSGSSNAGTNAPKTDEMDVSTNDSMNAKPEASTTAPEHYQNGATLGAISSLGKDPAAGKTRRASSLIPAERMQLASDVDLSDLIDLPSSASISLARSGASRVVDPAARKIAASRDSTRSSTSPRSQNPAIVKRRSTNSQKGDEMDASTNGETGVSETSSGRDQDGAAFVAQSSVANDLASGKVRRGRNLVPAERMKLASNGDAPDLINSPSSVSVSLATSVESRGVDPAARKVAASRNSTRLSISPRSQDPSNLKGMRSSNHQSASRALSAAAAIAAAPPVNSETYLVGANESCSSQDIAARKGMRASSRRGARGGSTLGTNGTSALRNSGPIENQAVVGPFEHTHLAGAVSADATNGLAGAPGPFSRTRMPSPSSEGQFDSIPLTSSQEQPHVPEHEAYAGLNYTGDVAIDGVSAYVAPYRAEEEAIDAVGVVTESQLKMEDKRKWQRLIFSAVGLFALLLVVVIVPIAVSQDKDGGIVEFVNITESPSTAPSSSPTSFVFAELLSTIGSFYGKDNSEKFSEVFSDESSPQYRAAKWTVDNIPAGITSGSDPRMVSRYALTAFYFSTNGDNWRECARGSTNCVRAKEWLTSTNECDWFAVDCINPANGDYSVIKLEFPPNQGNPRNIGGTLPMDVSFLSSLSSFVLTRESVSGPFPDWSQLSELRNVLLNFNSISGTFPAYLISRNSLLGTLHLEGNSFQGPLPLFSFSSSLSDLRLNRNNFTGPITSGISNLVALKTLFIDNNDLTGEIPPELYALSNLTQLHLSNNTRLTGTISSHIGLMPDLLSLRVSNTSLGGPLPDSLFSMARLQDLDLSLGRFTGPLSESFANLAELASVRLFNNSFTGNIPVGLGQPSFLNTLELHHNDLTGSVPATICARRGDGFLSLRILTVDLEEVSCTCCTN